MNYFPDHHRLSLQEITTTSYYQGESNQEVNDLWEQVPRFHRRRIRLWVLHERTCHMAYKIFHFGEVIDHHGCDLYFLASKQCECCGCEIPL